MSCVTTAEQARVYSEGTQALATSVAAQVVAAGACHLRQPCVASVAILAGAALQALAFARLYAKLQPNQTQVTEFWPVPLRLRVSGPHVAQLGNPPKPLLLTPASVRFEICQTWTRPE